MSTNYIPSVTSGQDSEPWQFASSVEIKANPNPSSPAQNNAVVSFVESTAKVFADGSLVVDPLNTINPIVYTVNPNDSFPILDTNGNNIGTSTVAQLDALVRSCYLWLAANRDASVANANSIVNGEIG